MGRGDRRKCTCCCKLFRPDPRNRRHQRYCSAPVCRAASKAASQALARQAREPRLFPRPGERRSGPALAIAPNRSPLGPQCSGR
jgi:hypothetical protein